MVYSENFVARFYFGRAVPEPACPVVDGGDDLAAHEGDDLFTFVWFHVLMSLKSEYGREVTKLYVFRAQGAILFGQRFGL